MAPIPVLVFSVFPGSTPSKFVWTRNNFICVCSRRWEEGAPCECCPALAGVPYSEKRLGLLSELREAGASSLCWFSLNKVACAATQAKLRHIKCSQFSPFNLTDFKSCLSMWISRRHLPDNIQSVQMCLWVPEGLAGYKLPTEPEEQGSCLGRTEVSAWPPFFSLVWKT